MKRSASEIIRNLEVRIAQLENSAAGEMVNVVDIVIPNIAYLQSFSPSSAIVDVPSSQESFAEKALTSEESLYDETYDLKRKRSGGWTSYTITSLGDWKHAGYALYFLQVAGFKIVSSSKNNYKIII